MFENAGAGEGQDDYAERLDIQSLARGDVDMDIDSYKNTPMVEAESRPGNHGKFDSYGDGNANRFLERLPSQPSSISMADTAITHHLAERDGPSSKSSLWVD